MGKYGGTNAHVVLQEAPTQLEEIEFPLTGAPYVLTLSAHNKETLHEVAKLYYSFLNVAEERDELGIFLLLL